MIHGKKKGKQSSWWAGQAKVSVSICQHPSASWASPCKPGKQPEQGRWENCRSLDDLPLPARQGQRGPILQFEDNTGLDPTPPPKN